MFLLQRAYNVLFCFVLFCIQPLDFVIELLIFLWENALPSWPDILETVS